MGRVLSTAFCVALLAAAAAAFALTEGAKTELSPIFGTKVDKVFSPTCNPRIAGCISVAEIAFKLRHPQRLEVWLESQATGKRVATLSAGRGYPKGLVRFAFSGRTPGGALLPDGAYLPVVQLLGDHRTFRLPNPIVIDTKAPHLVGHPHRLRVLIAPGAQGRRHGVAVHYTLSARGHGVLFANGHQVEFTYRQRLGGVLWWYGKIDGKAVPPGTYTLEIAVQDEAGNRSRPLAVALVRVRYLELAVRSVHVRPRKRFSVHVLIGPARVRFLFDGRRGTSARTLKLRAPKARGRYRLFVSGAGHATSAIVVVS